jgi:hypothetical protein
VRYLVNLIAQSGLGIAMLNARNTQSSGNARMKSENGIIKFVKKERNLGMKKLEETVRGKLNDH